MQKQQHVDFEKFFRNLPKPADDLPLRGETLSQGKCWFNYDAPVPQADAAWSDGLMLPDAIYNIKGK